MIKRKVNSNTNIETIKENSHIKTEKIILFMCILFFSKSENPIPDSKIKPKIAIINPRPAGLVDIMGSFK